MVTSRRKSINFDEPTIIPGDPWIEVKYFDVPGAVAGSIRMSLSDLIEWLDSNPGTLVSQIQDIS